MASLAGTTTGTLAVSATIANNCKFGTSTMAFGAYDPVNTNASTPLTATGSVGITCTSGDAVTLTANAGGNGTHASGACATATCTRAMFDGGTHYLSYDLYTTSGNTTVWNGTNSVAATGTGAAQTVNVYGYIPAAVADPAGSYTDSVTMTATF
jgi:spore coat protein U-like protein